MLRTNGLGLAWPAKCLGQFFVKQFARVDIGRVERLLSLRDILVPVSQSFEVCGCQELLLALLWRVQALVLTKQFVWQGYLYILLLSLFKGIVHDFDGGLSLDESRVRLDFRDFLEIVYGYRVALRLFLACIVSA